MFRKSTVFVLGAGASWHYGYPTGEGLIDSVMSMASRLSGYCEQRLRSGQVVQIIPQYVEERIDSTKGIAGAKGGWETVRDECELFCDRLKAVRPLLIDHFLAWNEELRPIGKLMIAAAILECEASWLRVRVNQNSRDITKPDDWYRFIIHKLVYGCGKSSELLDNIVHFITFNYDTSLEYHLFRALTAIDLLQRADVEKFFRDDRIIHVYGSVHPEIPKDEDGIDLISAQNLGHVFGSPLNHGEEFEPRKTFLDRCLAASANLRTVDPHDKEEDEESLSRARQWVADAEVVYILGYGFDQNNNRRIGLDPTLSNTSKVSGKCVMFTNYRNLNTINKTTSKLLYGAYNVFFGDQFLNGNPDHGNYAEKSVRTVYEALENDFYPLEALTTKT
jgi:hypothetical protein